MALKPPRPARRNAVALITLLVVPLAVLAALGATPHLHHGLPPGSSGPSEDEPLGTPALYEELREAALVPAGRIREGRLRVDRFEFQLTEGDLYLLEPVGGRVTGAVFLGRGQVRAYPPDAVEHQQLKKLLKTDVFEEPFHRLVLRFTDDTADRLRALIVSPGGRDLRNASGLYENRRNDLFRQQLLNPDSRVVADLLEEAVSAAAPRGYFLALVDSRKRGWFSVEVEPRDVEEVGVYRYDRGQDMVDVWMGFHALQDFEPGSIPDPFAGFPVDPQTIDKKPADITGADLGLPSRLLEPRQEDWSPRADVPLVTVDLALDDGGKTQGTAALLIDPRQPLGAVRLQISPVLEVTDVRWRTVDGTDTDPNGSLDLLSERSAGDKVSDPKPVAGEGVHFIQERRSRLMTDDFFEPWVTIALPRLLSAGERFILEVAYKGKIVEKLRASGDYLLRDTLFWIPKHPDTRRSRYHLTFRIPQRYEIVSGGDLLDDRVEDKTRLVRRVVRHPMRFVSFHYGRFDITAVELDGVPPITVYANSGHLGFAPGNREKTIDDLAGAIRTHSAYFGPFPFDSLRVTETPTLSGQAFPGFLLLSFQAFGELHTGEAELFRSHEVAHQWWGAGVGWWQYRDQWLSEGFAQYGAALYALAGLGQERQFREMLSAWRQDVLGQVNIGQGVGLKHYGFRPEVIQKSQGSASGPLVAGFRLRSTDTPYDYRLIVYEKGAFILHMLRMMLLDPETGDDEGFRRLMRRFASEHMYGLATTRAFEAAVSAEFGEPMDWFFDQWVYGVDVPTYRPSLRVSPLVDSDAPYLLHGTITQENVPEGFRMPVPIALRFPDRPPLVHRLWIDAEMVDVQIPLPARPSAIEFNYLDAVLARVR